MKYCMECGRKLHLKYLKHEGEIPYCDQCAQFRFPIFNTAVSMIVLNPSKDKILMIQQYGKPHNILVAGYTNREESLEETLIRELNEEIGRNIVAFQYMKSEYSKNSNTLICNFAVVLDQESLDDVSAWEIDHAQWFSFEEAKIAVKQASLAQRFVLYFISMMKEGNVDI